MHFQSRIKEIIAGCGKTRSNGAPAHVIKKKRKIADSKGRKEIDLSSRLTRYLLDFGKQLPFEHMKMIFIYYLLLHELGPQYFYISVR